MENLTGRIKIGVAGWSYDDWKGTFYPPGLKSGDRLAFLVEHFDCVEINSTFYANPRPDHVARWVEVVAAKPGFLLPCKLSQTLTHQDADLAAEARRFRTALAPLIESGRLGAVLAQFPWYFRLAPENLDRIAHLAELLGDLPLVLEVRHNSFLTDSFFSFLGERGIGLANIDLPASRTNLPASSHLFGPVGYFRFHGRNRDAWFDSTAGRDQKYDYLYTREELKPWVERIREVAGRAEKVMVIANNHYRGQAPANALDLACLLGKAPAIPETLGQVYPHLRGR
jgi:uncharacterized protein YecE (DUF72 family)